MHFRKAQRGDEAPLSRSVSPLSLWSSAAIFSRLMAGRLRSHLGHVDTSKGVNLELWDRRMKVLGCQLLCYMHKVVGAGKVL
jgi:hypothetical protein